MIFFQGGLRLECPSRTPGESRMSWEVSLWHLPYSDRIDLSAVPLACSLDRRHVS